MKNKIYEAIKRIIDIIGSIIGILLLLPISIIIYIARKTLKENNGSMFYTQIRIGKSGKKFKIYKYRTMVANAEEKLKEYLRENEQARKEFEEKQKLENDFRITKLGKFLRMSCIDELPQVINIFKGEMSFVGPRPVVEKELEKYKDKKNKFLSVKPGLTGYWQIRENTLTTYEQRMEMELYYIDNRSLKLDVKIFFKTLSLLINKI